MLKRLFSLVLMSAAVSAFAQTDSTSSLNLPTTLNEDQSRDRFLISFHWDGWMGAPDSLKVKGLSSGLGIHSLYDIPLGSDKVSFAIGAGFSWSNYYNNALFAYDSTTTYIDPLTDEDTIGYDKNKFVISYFEVPVEFRFRTKENNSGNRFKVAVGFKGGYMLSNHTKFVGEDYLTGSSDQIKYKQYRIKNVSTLQYGPTLRVGYGKVNIQAYYGLAGIFEDGKGPSGTPLTVGVSFNPF
jgi:hypothetical protein